MTDFGMSKLVAMNPRMTPLTMCPGTATYMPPEALINPPRYSSKLDCFSHGVLTIQIATRNFPNPTEATFTLQDARFPTGIVHVPVPEEERREKDIDLVDPNHPILPLARHCLKDRDTDRPSADELCERLATLKGEQMYTHSVEQSREQVEMLQQQIRETNDEMARARASHEMELLECQVAHQQQIQEKSDELKRARSNHEIELRECHASFQHQIKTKDDELEQTRTNHEIELRGKEASIAELTSVVEQLMCNLKEAKSA